MSNTTPPGGYLVPPQPGANPARPGTVSIASMLLYLLALIQLISAGLVIYTASFYDKEKIEQIYLDNGAPSELAETTATATTFSIYFGVAFALIFGVVYLVLAIFVGKGKQWARITTWVWAGLVGVCCGIFALGGNAASGLLSGMGGTTSGFDQVKAQEQIVALAPGWLNTMSVVLSGISLLAAIVVIVLLALPPSNPFFRKVESQWTPPTYPAP